jgi:protein phosphatase
MTLLSTAIIDKGVRSSNEDRAFVNGVILDTGFQSFVFENNDIGFFIVCDGVGGENGGEVAAEIALNRFNTFMQSDEYLANKKLTPEDIAKVIEKANEDILAAQSENIELAKMATSIAGIYLYEDSYIAFNAGDTCIHRFRMPYIATISTLHTLSEELLELGVISTRDEANSAQKNTITHYLGNKNREISTPAFDTGKVMVGDTFIISSDGLFGGIDDKELEYVMKQEKSLDVAAKILVDKAKENGSQDNISVVMVRKEENDG